MHQDLQRLTRELRSETCPQRVLDEVYCRIAAERSARGRFWYLFAGATGCVCLLVGLLFWPQQPAEVGVQAAYQDSHGHVDTARVTADVQGALGCIGTILRDAGVRSEAIILKGTVSPVRNSLETAKNKLINHI